MYTTLNMIRECRPPVGTDGACCWNFSVRLARMTTACLP
jgi:hypothetical protein